MMTEAQQYIIVQDYKQFGELASNSYARYNLDFGLHHGISFRRITNIQEQEQS